MIRNIIFKFHISCRQLNLLDIRVCRFRMLSSVLARNNVQAEIV